MHMRTAGTNASRSAEQNPSWRTVEGKTSSTKHYLIAQMQFQLLSAWRPDGGAGYGQSSCA